MSIRSRIVISLLIGLPLGAGLSALSRGAFLPGWVGEGALSCIAVFSLISVWKWAGGGRTLAWLVALAFFLRLGLGSFLESALPVIGYDEPTQKAGYHFYDAFQRDTQGWELAESEREVWGAFAQEFATDQYGGLLAFSAVVYRVFSPDAHRPLVIVLLGAFVYALGLPFLFKALVDRFDRRVALIATWIYALYPDSILLGASQMREPFLLGLTAVALWGIGAWRNVSRWTSLMILAACAFTILAFSSRIAVPLLGVLALWFWMENLAPRLQGRLRWLGWAVPVIAGAVLVFFAWQWLRTISVYDVRLTEINSGRIQAAIEDLGKQFRLPFIILYGLTQPVLPAAIADPSLPLWHVLAVFRALGWYLLAPLLIYAFFSAWKAAPGLDRWSLVFLGIVNLAWIVIASLRAGGDQWDNPRYRTTFLVFMAAQAAWGLRWAILKRDPWLVRVLLVEAVFVAFFTQWYLSRYLSLFDRLPFKVMLIWIAALSCVIIFGGWVWDRLKSRRVG